ncbi:MAG: phosphonate ABC transporter, permease protein PhnE [Terrimicrobiaceae bacterium]
MPGLRRVRRPSPWDAPRVTLVVLLAAAVVSLPALQGSGRSLDYAANLRRFLERFWPPDFSILPAIAPALWETFQIAVLATLASSALAIPIAAAASANIAPRPLVIATRFLLSAVRSIPSLIWALLAVAVFGANALAGVIALIFYSLGYLGKFFSDSFESADPGVAEALRVSGADRLQAFQFGIWPHARPLVWSHLLWMLEYNLRSAAIIGYVGAGGIGVWLHTYQEFYQWDKFATVLLIILGAVLVLDAAGSRLRRCLAPVNERPSGEV